MFRGFIGKSKDKEEDTASQRTRRKDDERKPTRRRSVAKVSSDSRKWGDDHDRELNPTSTSQSSTTRGPFSGTGAGSVASSYATAPSGRKIDEEYLPIGLARSVDPTSNIRSERRERDEDESRRRKSSRKIEKDRGWEKTQDREPSARVTSRGDNRRKERGLSIADTDPTDGSVRAPTQPSGSFSEQIGSVDFVQFPGQYDGPSGFIGKPTVSTTRISDHVQDQFPGQFPIQSAAPYRPPLGAAQGGPGLAADYYGDVGQSVAEQPGVRPHPPAVIVGAEPHLQAASSVVAPPPEPSASGSVGAAASFFTDSFNAEAQGQASYNQAPTASANAPTYQQAPSKPSSTNQYSSSNRPDNNYSASAPAIPTLGAAAAGAAAGYLIGSQSSHQQRPDYASSIHGHGQGRVSPGANYRPQSQSQNYDPTPYSVQHTKPSKHSFQSTDAPLNAAVVAGTAGLAAAAYQHNHHSADNPSMEHQYSSTTLAQRHRHHGPFSRLVDFFQDPDGVAQFEEYTEYIGVCKYCFAPGSTPRDAPRKHNYRRHRSNERYGGSARVDKDRRYWSSDGETRLRNKKSWFATGIAGYGLAKVAESLFNQDYKQSGRNHNSHGSPSGYKNNHSPSRKSYSSHGVTRLSSEARTGRRSHSKDRIETGITRDGKSYKQDSHGRKFSEPSVTGYESRRRSKSRSRSRSKDQKRGVAKSAIETATGSSAVFSSSRRRSLSPKKASVRSKRGTEEQRSDLSSKLGVSILENRNGDRRSRSSSSSSSSSRIDVSKSSRRKSSERRHKSHKRDKKSKGFFSFSNGSSSSSSNEDLAFGVDSDRRRSGSKSKARKRDHHSTDTALMGLGVAAAALSLKDTRERNKSKKMGELVAVKESKHSHSHGSQRAHHGKKKLSLSNSDEDLWESASDDDEYASADSNLAYGHSSRRASQESISSDSSGMSKWGWRWGGKRKQKEVIKKPRPIGDSGVPFQRGAGIAGPVAGASFVSENQQHSAGISKSSSVPLELVDRVSASERSRFDAIGQGSAVSSNQPTMITRPVPVPIQHPQPKISVPPAVYTSQPPFSHSYSAPIDSLVSGSAFPQVSYQLQPANFSTRNQGYVTDPEDKIPGSFPHGDQSSSVPNPTAKSPEPRRRDTSPSVYASELASDSIPSRRRNPYQDHASAVRFDLTAEQNEKDRFESQLQKIEDEGRRERLRRAKEDEDRRERLRQAKEDEDRRERLRQAKEDDDRRERRQREQEIVDQRERLRQQKEDEDRRERAQQEQEDQDRRERRRRERENEDQRERLRQQKEDEDRQERARQIQEDEVRREKRRQEKENEARQERRRQKQDNKEPRERPLERVDEEQRSNVRERREPEGKSNKPSSGEPGGSGRSERTEKETRPQIIEIEPRRGNSWAAPVAAGIIGAAIGAAAESETSKSNIQREKADEQKRREREYRNISDEDEKRQILKEAPLRQFEDIERKDRSMDEKPMSVWQAAAKARSSSHEDYAAYFTPPELLSRSDDQKHGTNANADNIIYNEGPDIITREPTGFHDYSFSPAYSFTPTGDETDSHPIDLSWVPTLKLITPTPTPSRAGSINDRTSPISQHSGDKEVAVEEPSKSIADPKVTWGEPETIEYIPITPMDQRDQFIESPPSEHDNEKENWQVSDIEDTIKHQQSSQPSGTTQSKDDGSYGDDLEFAAVLAAGLEDTGFDPSVVIDDPSFRRRNSPPGAKQLGNYSPSSKIKAGNSYSPTREIVSLPKSGFIEGEVPSVHVPGAFDEDVAETTMSKIDKNQGNEAARRDSIDKALPEKRKDGKVETISQGPEISTSGPVEFVHSLDPELKESELVKAVNSPKTDVDSALKGFEQIKANNFPETEVDPGLKGLEQIKANNSPKTDVDHGLKGFEQVKSESSSKNYVDPGLKGFDQTKADNSLTDVDPDLNRLEQVKTKNSPKPDADSGDDDLVLLSRNNTPDDEFYDASRSLSKNADSKASSRKIGRTPAESQLDQGTKDYDGEIQSTVSDPLPRKHRRNESPESRRSSENADLYESPSEDALSIAATAPVSNDVDKGGRTRRKSKRRSSDFADSASLVSSSRKHADGADPHPKGKKEKKSLFGFFSRSTENTSESPRAKERSAEETVDDFEESKGSKDSKDRRSSRHGSRHRSRHGEDTSNGKVDSPFPLENLEDDYERRLHKSKGKKEKRRSTGGNTTNDSGRISQDLPAKDQETSLFDEALVAETGDSLPTNADKQNPFEDSQAMSFLGMRQEIPPLPDSPDASDISSSLQDLAQGDSVPPSVRVNDDLVPISGHARPTSPSTKPEIQGQRLSELQGRDENLSHAVTSSPTAIPVNFRRPPSSPASNRSYSSTPISSNANTPGVPFRQKPRPRSTEFKSSNEFRPLWLVERVNSRQEPSLEENYPSLPPSLPSSHSNSRSSSIQDPEEYDLKRGPTQIDALDLVDTKYRPRTEGRGLWIDTDRDDSQSDLLDSQQPTPTAPSYDSTVKEETAPKAKTIQESEATPTAGPFVNVLPSTNSPSLEIDIHSTESSLSRQPQITEDLALDEEKYHGSKSPGSAASFIDIPASTEYPPSRQPQIKRDLALEDGLHQEPKSIEPVFSRLASQTASEAPLLHQSQLLEDLALDAETSQKSRPIESTASSANTPASTKGSSPSQRMLHDVNDFFPDRSLATRFNYDPEALQDLPSLPSSRASSPAPYGERDDPQGLSTLSTVVEENDIQSLGDAESIDLMASPNAGVLQAAVQPHVPLDQPDPSIISETRHESMRNQSSELGISLSPGDRKLSQKSGVLDIVEGEESVLSNEEMRGASAEQQLLERVAKLPPAMQSPQPSPETIPLPTYSDSDLSEVQPTSSLQQVDPNRLPQKMPETKHTEEPSLSFPKSLRLALEPQIIPEAIALPTDDVDLYEAKPGSSFESADMSSHLHEPFEGNYYEEPGLSVTKSPKAALEPQIIPEAIALPVDDDIDLFEARPESSFDSVDISRRLHKTLEGKHYEEPSLSVTKSPKAALEPQIIPEAIALPVDDDVDLFEAKPESSFDSVDINRHLHKTLEGKHYEEPSLSVTKSPKGALEPPIIPEAIALPVDDDIDLFEVNPESSFESVGLSTDLHKTLERKQNEEPSFSGPKSPKAVLKPQISPGARAFPVDDVNLSEVQPKGSFESVDSSRQIQETHKEKQYEELSPSISKSLNAVPDPRLTPGKLALPADDDLDLSEAQLRGPVLRPIDLSSNQQNPPQEIRYQEPDPLITNSSKALESQATPEAVALSPNDGVDLPEVLPHSPFIEPADITSDQPETIRETQIGAPKSLTTQSLAASESPINPEAIALPADVDLGLPKALWQSPLFEPIDLGSDGLEPLEDVEQHEASTLGLAESLKTSSEFQVNPESITLPVDDDIDLIDSLPESPVAKTMGEDSIQEQHRQAEHLDDFSRSIVEKFPEVVSPSQTPLNGANEVIVESEQDEIFTEQTSEMLPSPGSLSDQTHIPIKAAQTFGKQLVAEQVPEIPSSPQVLPDEPHPVPTEPEQVVDNASELVPSAQKSSDETHEFADERKESSIDAVPATQSLNATLLSQQPSNSAVERSDELEQNLPSDTFTSVPTIGKRVKKEKKDKKDKKKKFSQDANLLLKEPEQVEETPPASLTREQELEVPPDVPTVDDELISVKKKGKKGRKSRTSPFNIDTVLEEPELPTPTTSVPSEPPAESIEDTSTQTLALDVDFKVGQEQAKLDDDWDSGKRKGKSGKKSKNAVSNAELAAEKPETFATSATTSRTEPSDWAAGDDTSSKSVVDDRHLGNSQEAPIKEDEWAEGNQKMGEKNKISKSDNTSVAPSLDLSEELRPVLPLSTDPPTQPVENSSTFDVEARQEQPTADNDDDEWAAFTRKKGKKGKKNKKDNAGVEPSPNTLEEPRPVLPLPTDPPTQPVENSSTHDMTSTFDLEALQKQPAADNDEDDEWAGSGKKKGKKGKKTKRGNPRAEPSPNLPDELRSELPLSTDLPTQAVENSSAFDLEAHQIEPTADNDDDDEWAAFTKKKGKKGRKTTRDNPSVEPSLNIPEELRPVLPSSTDSHTPSVENLSHRAPKSPFDLETRQKQPAAGDDDDEWAGSGKKKGKKGKKSKFDRISSAAYSNLPEEREPSALLLSTDSPNQRMENLSDPSLAQEPDLEARQKELQDQARENGGNEAPELQDLKANVSGMEQNQLESILDKGMEQETSLEDLTEAGAKPENLPRHSSPEHPLSGHFLPHRALSERSLSEQSTALEMGLDRSTPPEESRPSDLEFTLTKKDRRNKRSKKRERETPSLETYETSGQNSAKFPIDKAIPLNLIDAQPPFPVESSVPDWESTPTEKDKKDEKSEQPELPVELPVDKVISPNLDDAQPTFSSEPSVPEPSVPDWETMPTEKGKKDEKKSEERGMEFPFSETHEADGQDAAGLPIDKVISPNLDDAQPTFSSEPSVPDWESMPTEKGEKDEKRSEKRGMEFPSSETHEADGQDAAGLPVDKVISPNLDDAQPTFSSEPSVPDWESMPTEKGKNDEKQSEKRAMELPSSETHEADGQDAAGLPIDKAMSLILVDVLPTFSIEPSVPDRESMPTEKGEKDEKSQIRNVEIPSLETNETHGQEDSAELPIDKAMPPNFNNAQPTSSVELSVPDRESMPTEKGEKDEKSQIRNVEIPSLETDETHGQEDSAELPIDKAMPPNFNNAQPTSSVELSVPDRESMPAKKGGNDEKSEEREMETPSLETHEAHGQDAAEFPIINAMPLSLKDGPPTSSVDPIDKTIPLNLNDAPPISSVKPSVSDWESMPARKEQSDEKSEELEMETPPLETDETQGQDSAKLPTNKTLSLNLDDVQPTSSAEPSVPDWGFTSTKKVKKDKKPKKRAMDSPYLGTEEALGQASADFPIDETTHLDLNVAQPTPSVEPSIPDFGLTSTRKVKKDKKSKKRAMDSPFLETEEAPEQGSEELPTDKSIHLDLNDTQPTPSVEPSVSDWGFTSTKKSKKDKKSKKRAMDSPSLETEEAPEQGSEGLPTDKTIHLDLNDTQPTPSVEPSVPDWGFTSAKKSKKDKKSKKRAMDSPSLATEEASEQGSAESTADKTMHLDLNDAQPTPSAESSIPNLGLMSTKKGKKDKKSMKRAMDSPSLVTEETPEQDSTPFSIDEVVPLDLSVTQPAPSTEPSIPDWEFPSTKKSKKSKRSEKRDLEIEVGATAPGTGRVPEQFSPPEASVESNHNKPYKSAHPSPPQKTEAFQPPTGSVDVDTSEKSESKRVEEPTAATNLDTGVIGTEVLQRRLSRKDKKRKAEEAEQGNEWTYVENEGGSESVNLLPREISIEEPAQPPAPEQQVSMDVQQQFQATPPQSPRLPTNQDIVTDDISAQTSTSQWEKSIARDSAVHISDSPLVPENLLVNRAVRDSGYQDIEASPPMQSDSIFEGKSKEQKDAEDVTINPLISEMGSEKAIDEQKHQSLQGSESTSQNPLNISVEVDPAYDVSISKPNFKRGRSRITSRATRGKDEHVRSDSDQDLTTLQTTDSTYDDPREPSPVSSTTKERSSVLFLSSPSTREDFTSQPLEKDSTVHEGMEANNAAEQAPRDLPSWMHSLEAPNNQVLVPATERSLSPAASIEGSDTNRSSRPSLFGGPPGIIDDQRTPSRSPFASDNSNRPRLNTITEYSPEESPLHKKNRSISDVGSPEHGVKSRRRSATPHRAFQHRMGSPLATQATVRNPDFIDDLTSRLSWPPVDEDNHTVDLERSRSRNTDEHRISRSGNRSALASGPPKQRDSERRSLSGASVGSVESISAIIRTPDQIRSASGLSQRGSGTPPLRRVDRSVSSDLRLAHKKSEAKNLAKPFEPEPDLPIPSSSTYDPTKDKGKGRVRDMADIYEGWGDVHAASPLSPTRPPSMRRRQSLQILDLETKLDQLVSENRLLQESKSRAEKTLQVVEQDRSQQHDTFTDAVQTRDLYLRQKDTELNDLKHLIEGLQSQVSRLTEINEDLTATQGGLEETKQRYSQLEADHSQTHQQWQQSTRELDELRHQHTQLSAGMEEIVRHEITVAVEEKNLELRRLRDELEDAREQVRVLQQQILASKSSENFIIERDEDYFDTQCQQLCGHVQQWVLRFSKFSDGKACYLASGIKDEKITDRFENAILDGSDVDNYLRDRVKRRDVFMSVVMSLVWEYIFTRYLFGMDREQRQKLKALEKTLLEVGPTSAVNKWRATTLTLLSKRESFLAQRAEDTEAVVQEIYRTLATFLPPPSHLVGQILDSLRKVMGAAVDLSIEMRTQRAEYMMLPPLQPEYDTNGELVQKVHFNASVMNERSGTASSNEEVEAQQAVVRMVLFPLVVKRGGDAGSGDEQIVVCPAQVLTAKPAKDKKVVRVMSAEGGRSAVSFGASDVDMGNMI